jgi:TonB family protein
MSKTSHLLLLAFLTAAPSFAQQTTPSAATLAPSAQPGKVKVYPAGPGLTPPQLLPSNLPVPVDTKCKHPLGGKVGFSFFVDTYGKTHNIAYLFQLHSEMDEEALRLITEDRFKPATFDGKPVVVEQTVEVAMNACADQIKDADGNKTTKLRLRSVPDQTFEVVPSPPGEVAFTDQSPESIGTEKIGGSISAPSVLHYVDPEFSDEARKAGFQGIVDAQGLPQNVRVSHSLGMGLDEKAIEAVKQFRFKPAMKDGTKPVAVRMSIQINFHLMKKPLF